MTETHEDGRWGTVSDATQVFGVLADTIRRRIKCGDLETRREQTPQGFRWLIRLPDEQLPAPPLNAPGSPQITPPTVSKPTSYATPEVR